MVKTVTVREYNDEAKFLEVTVKAPTDLPLAAWQSSSSDNNRHVDQFEIALPLDMQVRPGDVVALHVQISNPFVESNRFRPALEVGEPDAIDVMVEEGMIEEADDVS